MIKVCFYGPESTGKTEMARAMAAHYRTEFVPEVAKEMITSNDFSIEDIIKIGKEQTNRTLEKKKTASRILFCDTDLITTQIYSQYYLAEVPKILYELERQIHYNQYFLFDIDVPWMEDGLRDLGKNRIEMAAIFRTALRVRNIPYALVCGSWSERFEMIRVEIDRLLLNK